MKYMTVMELFYQTKGDFILLITKHFANILWSYIKSMEGWEY